MNGQTPGVGARSTAPVVRPACSTLSSHGASSRWSDRTSVTLASEPIAAAAQLSMRSVGMPSPSSPVPSTEQFRAPLATRRSASPATMSDEQPARTIGACQATEIAEYVRYGAHDSTPRAAGDVYRGVPMGSDHFGLGVPDVEAAVAYYDEFMPLVGFIRQWETGYRPTDWQGAQIFLYPTLEDGDY